MNTGYDRLFSKIEPLEPPAGLGERIVMRIHEERSALSIKRRLVLFSLGLAASLVVLVFSFQSFQSGIASSGFADFFSLLFSDFRIVTYYWQNYILSLLESLPIFSLAIFLAAIFSFLELLKFTARDAKEILRPAHLIYNHNL
jgi:ABC-type phosphate/phosphonate transport system permease subunit